MRKVPLVNGQIYHIFSRSIAKYCVFNSDGDFCRIINILKFYQFKSFNLKYSNFEQLAAYLREEQYRLLNETNNRLVQIIAFCIMPTHVHFLLKQIARGGISKFISKSLNSYSRYFNLQHKRRGPLWEGRFKNILVETDEQLLHLTRYIHLNPTSAGLVDKPEKWKHSSYHEYIKKFPGINDITIRDDLIDMSPAQYKKFAEDQISYQRDFSEIKKLLIDNYIG